MSDFPVLGKIMVKSCKNVDKALGLSKDRDHIFLRCPFSFKWLCLPTLFLLFPLYYLFAWMSIWPRVEKEKSGFTHHKESLWHHIPFYKGSESAPPFGLIHERERKREGCNVATLLRVPWWGNRGQQNLIYEDSLIKQIYCSLHITHADQPW